MKKINLLIVCSILIQAQNFLKVDRLTVDDGLSVSIINDIVQSSEGFLWIATDDGLNKFDGYSFEVFRKKEFKELISNQIHSLVYDSDNILWIGTKKGISKYNLNTKRFISVKEINGNDLIDVNDIVLGANSANIWFSTRNGLVKYDKSKDEFSFIKITGLNQLFLTENNELWAAHSNGLSMFDQKKKMFVQTKVKEPILGLSEDITGDLWLVTTKEIMIYNTVSKQLFSKKNRSQFFVNFPTNFTGEIYSDTQHRLWVATVSDGLFSYSYETNSFHQFKHDVWNKNTISHNHVTKLFEDKSGLFWVGTKGGLNKLRYYKTHHFKHIFNHPELNNSLYSNNVTSILNSKDKLWFALGLDGVNSFNKKKGMYTHIAIPSDITTLFKSNETIYVGTVSGLYKIDTNKNRAEFLGLKRETITSGLKSKTNVIYVSTTSGLYELNGNKFKRSTIANVSEIQTIKEDQRGNLWIGTRNGLIEYNVESNESIIYSSNEVDDNSLSDNEITSIYVDDENIIWIGTPSGLNYIDRSKVSRVKHDIRNTFVKGILQDKNKNVWFSTNYGLVRYDRTKNKCLSYLEVDGLQGNQFNLNSVSMSDNGTMYFGGINGVTEFLPDNIYFNSNSSELAFSDIQVNYKSILKDKNQKDIKELNLEYYDNSIVFQISSLDYSIPKKNVYQYKLEGFNEDWINSGTRRQITYTNLDPGNYTLRIRASNNDGVWSHNDRVLPININSPYWETLWFRSSVILLVILTGFIYYKIRTSSFKRQQAHLEREVEKRTYELIVKNHEVEDINESLEKENTKRKETEDKLIKALQETEAIFENVREGIFLLGSDYLINEQHSLELERMFHKKTLANQNFAELMKPLVTEKIYGAIKNFINLLYTDDIDEDVVLELNPIHEVEAHFEISPGEYETRTLRFQFKRIISNDDIANLLVTVTDITETLKLQQQLKDKEAKNKEEIEQLLSILKVDAVSLSSFLTKSTRLFAEIKTRFKNDHDNYSELLNEIFRDIHNLKGNANLLDIKFLVERFHRLEDVIREKMTISSDTLSGNDFLAILFEIGELQSVIENMNQLLGRVVSLSKNLIIQSDENEMNLLFKNIDNKISVLSKELGKKARFEYDKSNINKIPSVYKDSVKDILLQLVHNSIVHGVENVSDRKLKKKDEEAVLKLSVLEAEEKLTIKFRDDGIGLDLDKIKTLAVKRGKYTEEEIQAIPQKKLVPLIFEDGFSTEEKTSKIAGRGEGMSLVKQIVSKFKGKIKVGFAKDKYFEVNIQIPMV